MTHVLHIDTSSTITASHSRAASAAIVNDLAPDTVTYRDLAATPLPQITEDWVNANFTPADSRTEAQRAALALSDVLVAELQAADTVVIGLPLYNFSAPAGLKAWIDQVARAGVTFQYTQLFSRVHVPQTNRLVRVRDGTPVIAPNHDAVIGSSS